MGNFGCRAVLPIWIMVGQGLTVLAVGSGVDCSVGWLVGCFGLNGPSRQYFSLYRAVFQREGERKEKR